jgi:hypothetical protein
MVAVSVDCTIISETIELVCSGVPERNGIYFTAF